MAASPPFHCVLNIANALVFKLNQTDITSHIVLLLWLVWAETAVRIPASAKTGNVWSAGEFYSAASVS
jgi:hypothetical protein